MQTTRVKPDRWTAGPQVTDRRPKYHTHKRRKRGILGRLFRALLIAVILYVLVIVARIGYAGAGDEGGKADAIIVMGAAQFNGRPSPVYRARLDHAIELYRQKRAGHLLFTGGKAPGDTYTEASAGRLYALKAGVPDSAILEERQGRTTYQSLQASKAILENNGLKSAILVSDPFHAFRSQRIASDLGINAFVSPAQNTKVQSPAVRAKFALREVYCYTIYTLWGI